MARMTPRLVLILTLTLTTLTIYAVNIRGDMLPTFFMPGEGLTPLKVGMEWLLIAILGTVLVLTWQRRRESTFFDPISLTVALGLTILSELCFTLYSSVSDVFIIMGHLYKVASYAFLYQALVMGAIKLPYQLLTESQNVLQQLTDNIRQVFWLTSPDKKQMLYVSPACETIWGRSSQQLLDNPSSWLDAIHPADRERIQLASHQQADGTYSVEYRIIRPDGSERWIHDQAFPILDDSGEVQRLAGVAEDITDQKQVMAMIAASETRLRAILKTASDGIHILDTNGLLIDASDSFLDSIGQDHSALGRLHIWDWDAQMSPEAIKQAVASMVADQQTRCFETLHRTRDNQTFPVEISARAFRSSGGMLIYAASRDLRERRQAQAEHDRLSVQLMQAQKMESIGHLTGGIAHDFNNMLGAILGYAELLKETGANQSLPADRFQKYVGEILTAGNRAKELIAQMLIFSRISPDTQNGAAPSTVLKPVIKEVTHLLRSSIPSTIELNIHVPDEVLRARIHPVQLHQILLNLAINARDAIGEYGRIDIDIARRAVDANCSACHQPFRGDYLDISVTDSGKGIPDEVLPKVFDPFFTTKDVGKGTGMGLSVVHGILHSLDGHITVASRPGAGTTMHVLLPLTTDETAGEKGATDHAAGHADGVLAGLRIMVVDDEEAMAIMLREWLTLHGADVRIHTRPTEAIATFQRAPQSVDLVISDETMPGLSGLDMAASMLSFRPTLPIILCTGYSEQVDAEIAELHGIAGFLYKPVELDKLLALIQSCAHTSKEHGDPA